MKNLFFLIAISSTIVLACKKSSTDKVPELQVNKSSITFTSAESVDSFMVEATERWTITSVPDWLSVSPQTGTGRQTVIILCSPNNTFQKRTGTISINTGGFSSTVEVTQEQTFIAIGDAMYTAAGGTELIITGQGFSENTGGNTVKINGVVVDVVSNTKQQIVVKIPMGLGSGPIEIKAGDHSATSKYDFFYRWIGTVSIYAGAEEGHVDGKLVDARFRGPAGLHFDKDSNLFVAEYGNNYVRKISSNGTVTTLPGRIAHWTQPEGPLSSFDLPMDVVSDAAGNLFVVETNASLVTKIAVNGTVSVFAGGPTYGNADGTGGQAQFYNPVGIVADNNNNLFVADFANSLIRKITPDAVVTTIAGNSASFSDGVGTGALFHGPYAMRFNSTGDLIVADYFNNRVRKCMVDGTVTTIAGNGGIGTMEGKGVEAVVDAPTGIAIDREGRIIINEAGGRLRLIEVHGHVSIIDTPPLGNIQGVAVDASGAIYLSAYIDNRILKVTYK